MGKQLRVGNKQAFHSIEIAIKMSQSGDTILIEKGNYIEPNLLIKHPLHLIGIEYPSIENNKQKEDCESQSCKIEDRPVCTQRRSRQSPYP